MRGFTLIELLVVMVIISVLLTLAVPRYANSVGKAREAVLRQDLAVMREAIDRHFADTGRYPDGLETLVEKKYLRAIPRDPLTDSSESWRLLPPPDPAAGGVYDVHSGAPGTGRNGIPYEQW